MALDGALLAQQARRPGIPLGEEVNLATMVLQGTACYEGVSLLLQGGLRAMAARSGAGGGCRCPAVAHRRPASDCQWGILPAWGREPVDGGPQPFPLAVLLFGSALRAGWAWALALRLFAGLKGHVGYNTALFSGTSARRGGLFGCTAGPNVAG